MSPGIADTGDTIPSPAGDVSRNAIIATRLGADCERIAQRATPASGLRSCFRLSVGNVKVNVICSLHSHHSCPGIRSLSEGQSHRSRRTWERTTDYSD